jgi:hypothetical protein
VLVLLRFQVSALEVPGFLDRARLAVEVLGERPGFVRAQVAQALDQAGLMVLELEFTNVGSYRRALSSSDVKMRAVEFLSTAIDEPSAFEVLHERTVTAVNDSPSSLAPDHDTFGIGD